MKRSSKKALALDLVLLAAETLSLGGITLGFAKSPSNDGIEPDLKVIASVYNYAHVDQATMARAEGEALRVLHHAGLTVEWRNISLQEATRRADPPPDSTYPEVFLRIVPSSRSPIARRATLGCALQSPGGPTSDAWVLFDRVENASRLGVAPTSRILGHAMAHEIGHLLLGSNAHSVAGVMRATWRTQEYVLMNQGSLVFTPHQAEQLRLAVQSRIRQSDAGLATAVR